MWDFWRMIWLHCTPWRYWMLYMIYITDGSLILSVLSLYYACLHVIDTALPAVLRQPNELWRSIENTKELWIAGFVHNCFMKPLTSSMAQKSTWSNGWGAFTTAYAWAPFCRSTVSHFWIRAWKTSLLAWLHMDYSTEIWSGSPEQPWSVLCSRWDSLGDCSMSPQCSNIDYWCPHLVQWSTLGRFQTKTVSFSCMPNCSTGHTFYMTWILNAVVCSSGTETASKIQVM